MASLSQGTSVPSGRTGLKSTPTQPLSGNYAAPIPTLTPLQQTSPEQSISNQIRKLTHTVEMLVTSHEENSTTKEKVDGLFKALDRLDLGAGDGDGAHKPQPTRSDAVLTSLERIKKNLSGIHDRVENVGHIESDVDTTAVPGLVDDIRDAVTDFESLLASTIPGELPPSAPRACFGRDDIIEEVVGLATELTPIALIGAGGIGKTSIALTVLHHDRIKQRFGQNRRFIRCDQFPATLPHFLSRLSKVIGAGVENPENLATLIPFLSSKEMLIVLDNAESILDPQGIDSQGIHDSVEELCRLETICLCITSRISTLPPDCETLEVPTLSMESTRDAFYRIYKRRERSDSVDDVLERLDGHPLSITLLATVAHQNKWAPERLVREWNRRRTGVLQTELKTSLATAIELSLASPMFTQLGPDARDLLGVVAFYPQGVNEDNIEWLFPTISNGTQIFDKFCILSLTYRNNGFITMLAPLRDYLRPKDPKSSPLLCTTKQSYFTRISVPICPDHPGFRDAQWIKSEDVNVEHLLDAFTSIDVNSADIWDACIDFMCHLYWHKPRRTVLSSKVEGLPDDHPSKQLCLFWLSRSFESIGDLPEQKRLLNHTLRLAREQGDNYSVARTLRDLSDVNRMLKLFEEGIQQAEEAVAIFEGLGEVMDQTYCLNGLTRLFFDDGRLGAAENAASHTIGLALEMDEKLLVCQSHRALGNIYHSKGEREKAIHHFEAALGIASSSSWNDELFWIYCVLTELFLDEGAFSDANTHIERAKLYAIDHTPNMGRAMEEQAKVWVRQGRFDNAESEVLRALGIYEELGAAKDVDDCKSQLLSIERARESVAASCNGSDPDFSDAACRGSPIMSMDN